MKASLIAFVPICVLLAAYAQPSQESAAPKANDADVRLLETKIRQAWEDYKNKNKEAFARIFTSDAIEVEEGAEGPHDVRIRSVRAVRSAIATRTECPTQLTPVRTSRARRTPIRRSTAVRAWSR